MGNCLIAYPNRIDGATLSGGSWGGTLNNLKTRALSEVAESADVTTASTQAIIDLGATYTIRGVSLLNHNCSSAATITWSFGTSSGGAEAGSSGSVSVWRMAFDGVMRNFPSTYDSVIGYPYWAPYVHSADVSCRYIKFAIVDTGNSFGKIRIGRVFVGAGLVPAYNMDIGASIHARDLTEVERAQGGAIYYQRRRKLLEAKVPLSHFDSTERGKLMAAARGAGVHDEVMFVPDVADMANAQEFGFVGRFQSLPQMPWSMPLRWSTELALEELL
jgi:hypothetical protein